MQQFPNEKEFQEAISLAYSQGGNTEQKKQAVEYITQLSETEHGWSISVNYLCNPSDTDHINFWALGALAKAVPNRFPSLPEEQRDKFDKALIAWIPKFAQKQPHAWIKNKYAQLLVVTLKQEYPHRWKDFWPQMFDVLSHGESVIDIFLTVLDCISEAIIIPRVNNSAAERERMMTIKDAMREQCIQQIVNTWYNILGTYHEANPALAEHCLKCMQDYVEWIDISLIIDDNWVKMLFYLMTLPKLRDNACDCIYEMVAKKQAPVLKLELIKRLKFVEVLPQLATLVLQALNAAKNPEEELEDGFYQNAAKLAGTVGASLLDCIEKVKGIINQQAGASATPEVRQQAASLIDSAHSTLDSIVPTLFSLLDVPNIDVASELLDFTLQYASKLKRDEEYSQREAQQQHLRALLEIIHRRVQYTKQFNFEAQHNDYERDITEHRQGLLTAYKNLCPRAGNLVKQLTHDKLMTSIQNNLQPWPDFEATLTLWYRFGEVVKSNEIMDNEGRFGSVMNLVVETLKLPSNAYHAAQLTVIYDVLERYAFYFQNHTEHLPIILRAFLDDRGVCSGNEIVCSRAAYNFLKFTNTLKTQLLPCLPEMYENLLNILKKCTCDENDVDSPTTLTAEDQVYLYEAIANLATTGNVPYDDVLKYTMGTLGPVVSNMKGIVNSGIMKSGQAAKTGAISVVSNQLTLIAGFCTGFSGTTCPVQTGSSERRDVSDVFLTLCQEILSVLAQTVQHQPIREKVITFLHRMIDMLGTKMFQYVPDVTLALLSYAQVGEAPKVIRIPIQVMKKHKSNAVALISKLFKPVVDRVFALTNPGYLELNKTGKAVVSELNRIHSELYVQLFVFVNGLLTCDCSAVLNQADNQALLMPLMRCAMYCSVANPDLQCAKYGIQVLTEFVKCFHGMADFKQVVLCIDTNNGSLGALTTHTTSPQPHKDPQLNIDGIGVLQLSLELTLFQHFDINEGRPYQVLQDISSLHITMLQCYKEEFLEVMGKIVGAISNDQNGTQQYLAVLQQGDVRPYRDALKAFIQAMKQQVGATPQH